jgi:G3E family GTPase
VTGFSHVESLVELNNGCVCCTIEDYRFDLAIHELIESTDPTLVIIESTGVADPGPIVQRVARAGLNLDAIIAVVDASSFHRAAREFSVVRRQVTAADFLVVNKVDLASRWRLQRLRWSLARANRRALVLECERGRLDGDLLFAPSAGTYRASNRSENAQGLHLKDDGIGAFQYESAGALDPDRFEDVLRGMPSAIYRAKGFVRVAGNPWSCLFNFTCGRYELKWVQLGAAAGGTQAVFIGRDIERVRERILARMARCEVV